MCFDFSLSTARTCQESERHRVASTWSQRSLRWHPTRSAPCPPATPAACGTATLRIKLAPITIMYYPVYHSVTTRIGCIRADLCHFCFDRRVSELIYPYPPPEHSAIYVYTRKRKRLSVSGWLLRFTSLSPRLMLWLVLDCCGSVVGAGWTSGAGAAAGGTPEHSRVLNTGFAKWWRW